MLLYNFTKRSVVLSISFIFLLTCWSTIGVWKFSLAPKKCIWQMPDAPKCASGIGWQRLHRLDFSVVAENVWTFHRNAQLMVIRLR